MFYLFIFLLTATETFISPNDVATCSEFDASSFDCINDVDDDESCSDAYAFPLTLESFGGVESFRAAAAADSKYIFKEQQQRKLRMDDFDFALIR